MLGADADSEHLKASLTRMLDATNRASYSQALKALVQGELPAKKISKILFERISQ